MAEKVQSTFSSWREDVIEIAASEMKQVDFLDTRPNQFCIQNDNNAELLISISKIPTLYNYEFKIEKNSTDVFGRPLRTRQVYILNNSTESITIRIYSIYKEFNLLTLKKNITNVTGGTFQSDGVVKGFQAGVSLPTGSNTIGAVEAGSVFGGLLNSILSGITAAKSATTEIKTYLAGLFDGSHKLGQVDISNKPTVETVDKAVNNFIYGEQTNVTGAAAYTFANEVCIPNYISFLTNDGDTDISLTFTMGAKTQVITLKAGESISDIPIVLDGLSIAPKTSGDAISWRYFGVLR